MSGFDGFLVKELRDEHRDREWVDTYGFHWAWCEHSWVWKRPLEVSYVGATYNIEGGEWIFPSSPGGVNLPRDGYERSGPGPFMEAMHHKLLWEGR